MASNTMSSHHALFSGRVNNCFHAGRPAWKPNDPAIKKALDSIMGAYKTFLRKLERMQTTSMKDTLITEVGKMHAPELARPGNGKSNGKG